LKIQHTRPHTLALAALLVAAALAASGTSVCHDTPHHADPGARACRRCTAHPQCDVAAHCWPDGVCRMVPPFHLHLRQHHGAPHDALTEGDVDVEAIPGLAGAFETLAVHRTTLCACPSPRHAGAGAAAAHSVAPLDRASPHRTGCHTPLPTLCAQHFFGARGPVHAVAPPTSDYYVEVEMHYTTRAGPYVPAAVAAPPPAADALYVVTYVATLEAWRVHVHCAPGAVYDHIEARCVVGDGTPWRTLWFRLYALGLVAATALLAWLWSHGGERHLATR